jgi:hypothetical protein
MERFPTAKKVEEITRWHVKDRGWRTIGYHYLIDRNGTVATGRPVEQVGAHVQGHNTGTIGVCLIGGHGSSETDQFAEHFTPAQDKALRHLLADLQHRYKIGKVTGHNSYAAKACPGFNVLKWLGKPIVESAHVAASAPQRPVVGQPLVSKPVDVNETPIREHQNPDMSKKPPVSDMTPAAISNPTGPVARFLAALAAIADLFKRK